MISRLELKNFTVFSEANLEFSPQLNVIIGENGTGKTHLLKAMYACQRIAVNSNSAHRSSIISDQLLGIKIINVFGISKSLELVKIENGLSDSYLDIFFNDPSQQMHFIPFTSSASYTVKSGRKNLTWEEYPSTYLPAREILSIYPNFVSVYETTELEFDETWRDTAIALGAPLKKNLNVWAKNILTSIERLIGGEIVLNGGRFYLRVGESMREAPLLAEGHRKLAMLAQLIANGSIQKGSVLFWDEPEANLNAKLIRQISGMIMILAREGVQVFIATHSLFLLKEIEILNVMSATGPIKIRFFGLHPGKAGVQVMQDDNGDNIGDITALDEELKQTDRFLAANDVARERLEQTANTKTKRQRRAK